MGKLYTAKDLGLRHYRFDLASFACKMEVFIDGAPGALAGVANQICLGLFSHQAVRALGQLTEIFFAF